MTTRVGSYGDYDYGTGRYGKPSRWLAAASSEAVSIAVNLSTALEARAVASTGAVSTAEAAHAVRTRLARASIDARSEAATLSTNRVCLASGEANAVSATGIRWVKQARKGRAGRYGVGPYGEGRYGAQWVRERQAPDPWTPLNTATPQWSRTH